MKFRVCSSRYGASHTHPRPDVLLRAWDGPEATSQLLTNKIPVSQSLCLDPTEVIHTVADSICLPS